MDSHGISPRSKGRFTISRYTRPLNRLKSLTMYAYMAPNIVPVWAMSKVEKG